MSNTHRSLFGSIKTATQALLAVVALMAAPLAQAYNPADPLGLSGGLNLLAFDNLTASGSDVEGRVAVGANAVLSGYSINTKGSGALYSGNGLVVGGNLSFGNGSLWGNTLVGGNLNLSSGNAFENVSVGGNLNANGNWINANSISYAGQLSQVNPFQNPAPVQVAAGSVQPGIDFQAERVRTTSLSQTFDALSNTGSVANAYGTLTLNANHNSLAVFDLNSTQLNGNVSLANLASDTTVLINVHGQSVDFGSHGYDNFANGRVLFNLPEATQVTFAGGITASFLAPLASFNTANGVINGQVIVANWSGSTQVNDAAFAGAIAAVPEPETYAMLLAGLGTIGMVAKRRKKTA